MPDIFIEGDASFLAIVQTNRNDSKKADSVSKENSAATFFQWFLTAESMQQQQKYFIEGRLGMNTLKMCCAP